MADSSTFTRVYPIPVDKFRCRGCGREVLSDSAFHRASSYFLLPFKSTFKGWIQSSFRLPLDWPRSAVERLECLIRQYKMACSCPRNCLWTGSRYSKPGLVSRPEKAHDRRVVLSAGLSQTVVPLLGSYCPLFNYWSHS